MNRPGIRAAAPNGWPYSELAIPNRLGSDEDTVSNARAVFFCRVSLLRIEGRVVR